MIYLVLTILICFFGLFRFRHGAKHLPWRKAIANQPTKADLRAIAEDFFNDRPELKDEVIKAYYAYHVDHFRSDPNAHNFPSSLRQSKCAWCGRSRELVRWDEFPAGCAARPVIREIEDVILDEESKAFALAERAERDVPKMVDRMGMSGGTLFTLHSTHGFDPDTVSGIVNVSPTDMAEYERLMQKDRERSREAFTPVVISVLGQ